MQTEDGGKTWGPEIAIGDGIHGGGTIVDQRSVDVLVFTHPDHPPRDGRTAPRTVYRSTDHGKTWQKAETTFHCCFFCPCYPRGLFSGQGSTPTRLAQTCH